MPEPSGRSQSPALDDAARVRTRAVNAGRWYGGYLAAVGVVSAAYIVLLETAFPDGLSRLAPATAWAAFMVAASWWADRHAAYPAGATRRMRLAFGAWFLSYLLVVGPLVRGQFDDALLPWTLAAALLSSPFFIAAAQVLRRR